MIFYIQYNNIKDYIQYIYKVLQKVKNNSLFSKLEKSNFYNLSATFLKYIILQIVLK